MSRFETTAAITASLIASIGSHVLCCGVLPLALNASAGAMLSSLGVQLGFAGLTVVLMATGVTFYERHRHRTLCARRASCRHRYSFNMRHHFLRNLVVGGIAYMVFTGVTRLGVVHEGLEQVFKI